jgi:hypothetical protein
MAKPKRSHHKTATLHIPVKIAPIVKDVEHLEAHISEPVAEAADGISLPWIIVAVLGIILAVVLLQRCEPKTLVTGPPSPEKMQHFEAGEDLRHNTH